jgi:hypothetical protein
MHPRCCIGLSLEGHERTLLEQLKRLARLFEAPPAPAFVLIRPDEARRCPDCATHYRPNDRYCPSCHTTVPEWRFG